jgi:hypothetical protein
MKIIILVPESKSPKFSKLVMLRMHCCPTCPCFSLQHSRKLNQNDKVDASSPSATYFLLAFATAGLMRDGLAARGLL